MHLAGMHVTRHVDAPASCRELGRVAQQIEQDLLQLLAIGACSDGGGARRQLVVQLSLSKLRFDERAHGPQRRRQRNVGHVVQHASCIESRKVEYGIDEPQEVTLVEPDLLQIRDLSVGHRPAQPQFDQLGVAGNRIERRAQFVRHHGQEVALGSAGAFGFGPGTFCLAPSAMFGRQEPRVVERQASASSQFLCQRQIALVEAAAHAARSHSHDTEYVASSRNGDHQNAGGFGISHQRHHRLLARQHTGNMCSSGVRHQHRAVIAHGVPDRMRWRSIDRV